MLKINVLLSIFIFLFLTFPVSADVVDPNFINNKIRCANNQNPIKCSYKTNTPYGERNKLDCATYLNDPQYKLVSGTQRSLGGELFFCKDSSPEKNTKDSNTDTFTYNSNYLLKVVLLTVLVEVVVLALFGAKKSRSYVIVVLTTMLTVVAANILLIYFFKDTWPLFLVLGLVEAFILFMEYFVYKRLMTEFSTKKKVIFVIFANAFSFILGLLYFYLW
jgi:hypothetical protein